MQACYLVQLKDKVDIYRWVIDGMAAAKDEFLESGEGTRFPITRFLGYYLYGRDSVAQSVLEDKVEDLVKSIDVSALRDDEKDIRKFWLITGLIECGSINHAETLLKKFRPADAKLYFGIHLGCMLAQHVRVSSKQEKDGAKRICDSVMPKVADLRNSLFEEMKSEILEVRQGNIKAIEPQSESGDSGNSSN